MVPGPTITSSRSGDSLIVLSSSLLSIETDIVYPPCDTTEHQAIPLNHPRQRTILSLGQFRPEKDHVKQLYILRKLIDLDSSFEDIRLVLVGGCRNAEDEKRVEELKCIAADLGMSDRVVFEVNVRTATE